MKNCIFLFLLLCISSASWSGIWTKKTNFGGTGRHRAVGGSVLGRGYLGMGHVNGAGADISYRDWWEFDPATNSWTQKADFPVAVHGAVSFSLTDKIYVGGGSSLTNQFYAFDPELNSWNSIAPCPLAPGDIQGFSAEGKGYVIFTNLLAEYNPQSGTWATRANVPVNVGNWSCTFSNGSSGFLKVGHALYEYKPIYDIWIPRATHPGLSSGGSSGFCINGIGYVSTGYVGGLATVTEEVWAFNPAVNQWNRVEDFPGSSRRFIVGFTVDDKGYIGTGTNGINLNDFWEYDPSKTAGLNSVQKAKITLYPNPCIETLYLDGIVGQCDVSIYENTGKLIGTFESYSNNGIDVSSYPNGKYLIKFSTQTATEILSFYKN